MLNENEHSVPAETGCPPLPRGGFLFVSMKKIAQGMERWKAGCGKIVPTIDSQRVKGLHSMAYSLRSSLTSLGTDPHHVPQHRSNFGRCRSPRGQCPH